MDKNIFRDINYGMYIVSCKDDENDKDAGCVINTLLQLTSDNPLVAICLNKENYTNKIIKKTKRFIVSILSEKTNPKIIGKFGFSSSQDTDKFVDEDYIVVAGIKTLKNDVCGYLECSLEQIIDVGTHDLFIAKVNSTQKLSNNNAMSYKYYHETIKGKAPRKAPTYIADDDKNTDEETYICEMCGYIHKGKLPADFKCPICGVDASHFKKEGI